MIHAYVIPYEGMIYPRLTEDDAEEYKAEFRAKAAREIGELVAASAEQSKRTRSEAPVWRTHVRYGPPRTVIGKAVKRIEADLLVLGTRGHSGVAHAFLGSVAGDVLREVPCDVLVVPPRDPSEPA